MLHHKIPEHPENIYPSDEWRMVEKRFYPRFLPVTETLFSTANGYFGMRGGFEEDTPTFQKGTFVNGFYESWPIVYPEKAYGFATTGQTIVNVTDCKTIKLFVDDEPFNLSTATLLHFERGLNMKWGTLEREVLWETPSGKQISIKSQRLVSFQHRHLGLVSYQLTVLNAETPIVLSSEMVNVENHQPDGDDPRGTRVFKESVLLPKIHFTRDRRVMLGQQTRASKMTLACGIDHSLQTENSYSVQTKSSENSGKVIFTIDAKPEVPILLTKFITYHTSGDAAPEELCERAERTLDRGVALGFDQILTGQKEYLDEFWRKSDVQVRGNSALQQAIRFNLFQILQAVGRADGVGVAAKGLTGQGYEGHYFWDTEIFVFPFLIYTAPRIAKNLLKFRYSLLDKARERARQVNQKGALFPWRTINGEEASAYYAAGTAQYHINADIVYALRKYVEVTGDTDFLNDLGAEILVETARLWRDLGFFSERKGGKFCINGVTGPDEYNTVVNNNTYTNLMARENLWFASRTLQHLREEDPERFEFLTRKTGLDLSELDEWKRAADLMYVPYDEKTGIHPQDDSFLEKEMWDFKNIPPEKYPLLLHFHPLVIYRHQVIKQADVVLAMYLLDHHFSFDQKKRNFDYYDPLTTGDSSLSACIQAIVAAELGNVEMATKYVAFALLMDLADVPGNVKDGCHIASMGGTWMGVVYGLAGLRDSNGEIIFKPRIPAKLDGVRFSLTIKGQLMEVDIDRMKKSVTYCLKEGSSLLIKHVDEEIKLIPGKPISRKVDS